ARERRRRQRCAGAGVRLGRRRQPAGELRVLSRFRSPHRILWRGRDARLVQSDDRLHARLRAFPRAALRPRLAARRVRRSPRRSVSGLAHCPGDAAHPPSHRRLRERRHAGARHRPAPPRAVPGRRGGAFAGSRPLARGRAAGRGGGRVSARRVLITGGSGFIGSALVKALLSRDEKVRVLDDNSRGAPRRLRAVEREIEFVNGDVRDAGAVDAAMRGIDEVHHLAFVNGTATFYSQPELVLDVGGKGIVNVIDACRRNGVGRLVLASSSEVYQSPPRIPTDESAPLVIPDPLNPRLSYAAGKIISEMLVVNHGRKHFERVLIFRPHNVYGPDMGFDHVIPQFALRLKRAAAEHPSGAVAFPIQGSGEETRSFCHIDDLIEGVMIMREKGEHLGIYHVGTSEEVAIADLARRMAAIAGVDIALEPSALLAGSAPRRCPDISNLAALGYRPRVPLDRGLPPTVKWYWDHESMAA